MKGEKAGLLELEVQTRKELFDDLWQKMKDKESISKQKSRQRWLVEGDASTTYFHAYIKVRRKKNQIVSIWVDDLWVEEPLLSNRRTRIITQKCSLKMSGKGRL